MVNGEDLKGQFWAAMTLVTLLWDGGFSLKMLQKRDEVKFDAIQRSWKMFFFAFILYC